MKMMKSVWVGMLAAAVGCGDPDPASTPDSSGLTQVSSQYVVTTEPDGAVPVGKARETAEDKQTVTLVGVIGGSTEPFVDGLAAFTIVDPRVPYCAAEEGCPTPWDYCCTQDQVKDNIATVKIVDDTGKPVADDARKLLGVKELSTVVVQGTADRDDQGNLTVAATGVFVRPGQ